LTLTLSSSLKIAKWPTASEIPKKTSKGGTPGNKPIAISKGIFSPSHKGEKDAVRALFVIGEDLLDQALKREKIIF